MIEKLLIAQGVGMAVALAILIKARERPKEGTDWAACAVAVIVWPIVIWAMVQGIRDRVRRQRQFRQAKAKIEPMRPSTAQPHSRCRDDLQ